MNNQTQKNNNQTNNLYNKHHNPKTYFTKLAVKEDDYFQVYSIRYKSFIYNKSIIKNNTQLFSDKYDKLQNSFSFILSLNKKHIGSIRACIYAPDIKWNITPSISIYKEEIFQHISLNKRFVESTRFCILPEYKHKHLFARFHLFKKIFEIAIKYNAEYIITAIKPKQQRLYQALFFKQISDEKNYPGVTFKTILMLCNLKELYLKYQKNPTDPKFIHIAHFLNILFKNNE